MQMQTRMLAPSPILPAAVPFRSSSLISRRAVRVSAEKETSAKGDSYSKIEAPVRDEIPDGGKPVAERDMDSAGILRTKEFNRDTELFGTEIGAADAMRFMGAIPEVANSRLSMLGVFAAVGAEAATGKNVFEQVKIAPIPIALTFFIFTVATAVPVLKGVPRKGNSLFTADAELINGRIAMVGFAGLVITTLLKGTSNPFA